VWVNSTLSLFRDESGEPEWWVSVVEDISDREQVEAKLQESEQRFRGLMEQAPMAISLFTPDGKLAQVNPAWKRSWGFDESEAARVMAEYNFLTDEQIAETGVLPLVQKAFAGDPVVLPLIEYNGIRSAGEIGLEDVEPATLWLRIHLYPIKDAQGAVERVVAINVDTTELKRAERDAREQRETLARLDRAARLGQLRGSIAHELNQPLTGILSNAQAAELMLESDRWTREDLTLVMSEIVADAKRAGDVIRGLRELYREHKEDYSLIDINTLVAETTRLLHSEMVLQQVELTSECAAWLPRVNGNSVQIQQVMFNLIMNGVQAMGSMPRGERLVRVATALRENEVIVRVEDNGPGIDEDKIDRIFEPLATWKPGGTGMGLAISSSIIQAHGGRMWAENGPDGGARVGFAIPVPQ
jgi:signal transduction histidine kinase